jgi:hypothetical protein
VIASARPADPLDRVDLVVDQGAKPADLDRFLDALDRLVERRLSQRDQNETSGRAMAACFCDSSPSTRPSQEVTSCPNPV